ncbi:MAG: SHOCT-like domain-containing protein [Anaerovoracaceae bacterium]
MDEKMRILKMVEEGTITAEQAAELMKAMSIECGEEEAALAKRDDYGRKMFRIIVDSEEGDKVNIQFPVDAVKKILKVTGKLPIPQEELEGIDLNETMEAISECLDEEVMGDFVNVETSDGAKVRIFVDKG